LFTASIAECSEPHEKCFFRTFVQDSPIEGPSRNVSILFITGPRQSDKYTRKGKTGSLFCSIRGSQHTKLVTTLGKVWCWIYFEEVKAKSKIYLKDACGRPLIKALFMFWELYLHPLFSREYPLIILACSVLKNNQPFLTYHKSNYYFRNCMLKQMQPQRNQTKTIDTLQKITIQFAFISNIINYLKKKP
jgi:hypothetical protein